MSDIDGYTEKEMKEKWCPLSDKLPSNGPGYDDIPVGTRCLGSRCGVWMPIYSKTPSGKYLKTENGCCGFAGKPITVHRR